MLSATKAAGKDAGVGAVAFVYTGGGGCQEAEVTRRVWTSNKQREGMEGVAVWMWTLQQRKDGADWKPSAKLFNPHSRPGPDQHNSPGNWRLDTPDVFPSSSHSVCEVSDNVCVCLCLTSDLMVKTPYWSPGVLWTSNLDHLQQRFTL